MKMFLFVLRAITIQKNSVSTLNQLISVDKKWKKEKRLVLFRINFVADKSDEQNYFVKHSV